jgi:hypothetical protein
MEQTKVSTKEHFFISYLPCEIERGINPERANEVGLSSEFLGWKAHFDATNMEHDFESIWNYFVEQRMCPRDLFVFDKRNLPKTVEETPNNFLFLRMKIQMFPRYRLNFIILLGHGHPDCGSLGIVNRTTTTMISPEFFFQSIRSLSISHPPNWICLLVDSCYSGMWVEYARTLTGIENFNIVVQSSCASNQDAYGGLFTPIWLYLQRLSDSECQDLLEEFKSLDETSISVPEQHPQLFVTSGCSESDVIKSVRESDNSSVIRFFANPFFFQFLVNKFDIKYLGVRQTLRNDIAKSLLELLVSQTTNQIQDFKLFTLSHGVLDLSALFELNSQSYILHVHYENASSLPSITKTVTVFTARHPVQDPNHEDFTGWNKSRWNNESIDIFKEDRTAGGKPGKFLNGKLSQDLDNLLRDHVSTVTGDANFFNNLSNWTMCVGYSLKMRSRRAGSLRLWPTLTPAPSETDGKLEAEDSTATAPSTSLSASSFQGTP